MVSGRYTKASDWGASAMKGSTAQPGTFAASFAKAFDEALTENARRRSKKAASKRKKKSDCRMAETPFEKTEQSEQWSGLVSQSELDRRFDEIREGFTKADARHRDMIDLQVMKCVRTAGDLASSYLSSGHTTSVEFDLYYKKRGCKKVEALKYVFKKVFSDAKKVSFYYRATFQMFEAGVPLNEYSQRINKAGGYRKLAASNVRFAREDNTDQASSPEEIPVETNEANNETDSKRGIPALQKGTLSYILEGEGANFDKLQLPSFAHLGVHLETDLDGNPCLRILYAISD